LYGWWDLTAGGAIERAGATTNGQPNGVGAQRPSGESA
jgi:hypothetical protein